MRLQAQLTKQARQEYLDERSKEADEMTTENEAVIASLQTLLEQSIDRDHAIRFASLKVSEALPPFVPPKNLSMPEIPPLLEVFTRSVKPRSVFEKILLLEKRYGGDLQRANEQFAQAHQQFLKNEADRLRLLDDLRSQHQAANTEKLVGIRERNTEVDQLEAAYLVGETAAVVTYCSLVLERSSYPPAFPHEFRLAYVPESKELVVDYQLPTLDVVPSVAEYRYIKSKDAIDEKPRKPAEIKEIYRHIVAGVALRALHELFGADQWNHLDVIVFSGFVEAVDPATGQPIKPYLISVRSTVDRFRQIDLHRIDKIICLRNLGAQVSPQPTELQPVKPLIEFDRVDRRFVEGSDVLTELESRPNLMDLTPFQFEQLVGNLFTKMGLDSKQTRSSRDGGVDVVAFDTRPVIGGKVVIQAKRYRHTVGVSAVRDLFGTMNHEGANKGILVSTSGYGRDAYDFIQGKPIELIDGGALLYYLEQHANVKARIVFPVED